jgi:hypothetical protein
MRRFSGRDSIDPDDPELDYLPLSLSERASKLGPSASQAARSERIKVVLLPRPTVLGPKPINEPGRRSRDPDRRAALLSVAARVASVAGVAALVALLFFIMNPTSQQSVSSSTRSETTRSTPQSNQGNVESKQALAASLPSEPVTQEQSQQLLQRFLQSSSIRSDTTGSTPQYKHGDEKSNPTLAESKALSASLSSDPATQERSEQLLQRFLLWGEKVDAIEAPVSTTQRR